jgi:hypothetical protein
LHTVLLDVLAAHRTSPQAPPDQPVGAAWSLKPRTDTAGRRHLLGRLSKKEPDPTKPAGMLGTLLQIEDDVCAYVCRNDLRERIRSFVRAALLRIVAREDVARVVVNSHSNGTVIGFDTLRNFPAPGLAKVETFLTAGSPLRKYAELFTWGFEVGNLRLINNWANYFDPHDPVADPLAHEVGWTINAVGPAKDFDHFVSLRSGDYSRTVRSRRCTGRQLAKQRRWRVASPQLLGQQVRIHRLTGEASELAGLSSAHVTDLGHDGHC